MHRRLILFMVIIIDIITVRADFNIDFQQNDFHVIPHRAELLNYNRMYVNKMEIKTFKYNRTCTAFNFSYNFNYDVTKTEAILQVYKFASNEYRLFPIRVRYNVCKAINQNFAGTGTISCGNTTGCSVIKGKTYVGCNWVVDQTKFPPHIPSGDYMLNYQFMLGSVELGHGRGYGSVIRNPVNFN